MMLESPAGVGRAKGVMGVYMIYIYNMYVCAYVPVYIYICVHRCVNDEPYVCVYIGV